MLHLEGFRADAASIEKGATVDLEAWNALLVADLKEEPRPSERLYLYVDRERLARISGLSAEQALESFCSAFKKRAARHPHEGPFYYGKREAVLWAAGGYLNDPPFVAHLAMSVLAVTEDPHGNPNAVYPTQNRLIGLPGLPRAPRDYGEHVPCMWEIWNAWLLGPGAALGSVSARTHATYTKQGWARSQGLVRHSDRELIEQFVHEKAVKDDAAAPSARDLLQWMNFQGSSVHQRISRFSDPAAQAVLSDVLDDEVLRYRREGKRLSRKSSSIQGALICDDEDQFIVAIPVQPSWRGRTLDIGGGQFLVVDAAAAEIYVDFGNSRQLLAKDGAHHHLDKDLGIRAGGRNLYLMIDCEGDRREVRQVEPGKTAHVLVRRTLVASVEQELARCGHGLQARPSLVPGWYWFDDVPVGGSDAVSRALGLAAATAEVVERPCLDGGWKLTPSLYLLGGAPDVVVPRRAIAESWPLQLDGGSSIATTPEEVVRLAEHDLAPGEHHFSCGDADLSFFIKPFVREKAERTKLAGVLSQFVGRALGDSGGKPETAHHSTSCIQEQIVPPTAVRIRQGAELILLCADGGVLAVPGRPPSIWRTRLDVYDTHVDLLEVLGCAPSPSLVVALLVLSRNSPSMLPQVRAFPVPKSVAAAAASGEPVPGQKVKAVAAPPNVLSELITTKLSWSWIGASGVAVDAARKILHRALVDRVAAREDHQGAGPRQKALGSRDAYLLQDSMVESLSGRQQLEEGMIGKNPYDDVLQWLSELEKQSTSLPIFNRTWEWTCSRYGLTDLAYSPRFALRTLAALGHVEVDWRTQRVDVAPALLTSLPGPAAMSVLSGTRPLRLIERLEDPDDDHVGTSASGWFAHLRTPVEQGRPTGPTAVYVEWDPEQAAEVTAALARLGITLTGHVARSLMDALPSMSERLAAAEHLTASPNGVLHRWSPSGPTGGGRWCSAHDDRAPGLYRHKLKIGNWYVWRDARGQLLKVEQAVGRWLAGRKSLLVHRASEHLLEMPLGVLVPDDLERALVMRSGLPPYRAARREHSVPGLPGRAMIFENVDGSTALRVASVLGQSLGDDAPRTTRSNVWTRSVGLTY